MKNARNVDKYNAEEYIIILATTFTHF